MSRIFPRLMALSGAMLLPSLGTSIANVALPSLVAVFDAPFARVQWVVIAYLLSVTALVVVAGRLGDMLGHRRLLLWGIAIFAAASAAGAFAPQLGILIAARAAQGIGAALMMALTVAMVGDLVPKERTGSAVGLLGTVSAVGTALGPSLGGALLAVAGWQALFALMALVAVAVLGLSLLVLPSEAKRPHRESVDLVGTGLMAISLGAFALAFTRGSGLPGGSVARLLTATALLLFLFVSVERRSRSPLVQFGLLSGPGVARALIAMMLVSAIVMATLVVGPFWLTSGLGLSPAATGLVMTVGPAVAALTGVPAGRLVDRFGATRLARIGLAVNLAGCLSMAALASVFGVLVYVVSLSFITFGYASFQAANTSDLVRRANAAQRGVTSGLLVLARNLGLILGASAMASIYDCGVQGILAFGLPPGPASGLALTFGVSAVLAGIALTMAWIPDASTGVVVRSENEAEQ